MRSCRIFLHKNGILGKWQRSCNFLLRIDNKIKPGIFDEKRGIAALLIKNSGFYFVRNPKLLIKHLINQILITVDNDMALEF